jgi:hypothetical protein
MSCKLLMFSKNYKFCMSVKGVALLLEVAVYQGHTKKPSGSGPQKYQPYVFGGNTWLGFMVAEAVGGAGCKPTPCNQRLQQLQPP